jgi:hypothetical protein
LIEKNVEGEMDEEGNSTCSSGEEADAADTDDDPLRGYGEALDQISISKDKDLPFFQELKERLDFLMFLYSNSSESMQNKHLNILWSCMVINAFSEKE